MEQRSSIPDWPERLSLPNLKRPSDDQGQRKLYSVSLSQIQRHVSYHDYHFKPSPFYVRWINGYNHKAGVINLNDNGSTTVFYAASNFGVLYDWTLKKMKILQGHRHMVTCIAADSEGQWLVTGDTGSDNLIIIWEHKDVFPARTIFSPHGNVKLARLALSADAKYLLTLGYGKEAAQLNWWIWSLGAPVPHAKIEVESMSRDSIIEMQFNPSNSHQFVLLSSKDVWLGITEKIFVVERGVLRETDDYQLKIRRVEKKDTVDTGKLTCFTFVKNTQILVGTSRGLVLVYAYSMQYKKDAEPSKYENLKFIKALKSDSHRINVITWVDDVVVTGNGSGQIRFFDDQMKLLYWVHGFTVESVRALSFNLKPRSYIIIDTKCKKRCPCWESVERIKDPVTGLTRTILVKKKLPTNTTKAGLPFLVRDFIVCCYKTGIGFVDFVTEKLNIILNYRISAALALTIHPEKMLMCIGYMDGHVELLNFLDHRTMGLQWLRQFFTVVTPPDDESIHGDSTVTVPILSVTCLKYSPSGLHLACGLNTGQLLFLDPTTIDIKTPKPFQDSKYAIIDIVYSPDSMTLAYSDKGNTVCVYKYDCATTIWKFIGKRRAHYKDINTLMFLPVTNPDGDYKLISIGNDRVMAEYNIGASADEQLGIASIDRIDQTAVPLAAIVWPKPDDLNPEECHTRVPTLLVANDQHKYKIVNYETGMTLATYLGPRFEHPVRKVVLVKKKIADDNIVPYILFATKVVIGFQKLPIDGNPWKHVGMLGHPNQILRLHFRDDIGMLFTIGARDSCVTQWQGNSRSVEKTTIMGGLDLDPYYCLLENGRPGWLFQEIRDLFYYIQILCQGTFSPAKRRVKDYIPIDSLPDLMRALGFFPTEYEMENLLIEAKYQVYNKKPRPEIDFEEFVLYYLNHRPAFLYTNKKIRSAFKVFAHSSKDGEYMHKDDFVEMLCTYGECYTRELAWYLLSILKGQSFEDRANSFEEDWSFLPNRIKIGELLTTILGIPETEVSEQQSGYSMASNMEDDFASSDSDQGSIFDKIFKY